MIVLVTGGTGFLGRCVVRALAETGSTVRCLVRTTSNLDDLKKCLDDALWRRLEIVPGELTAPDSYRAALVGVDCVIHLAAGMTGGAAALVMNTVIPTRIFAQACAAAAVPRFVLVSSLGVYGASHLGNWETLDETCPVDNQPHLRDPYTYSKILQESTCRQIAQDKGLPLVVVRPGVIFGPGRGALSTRVGLSVAGWTFRIGDSRLLPYTYVDNCAAAICKATTTPGIAGETFNILDDDLPSVKSVLSTYRRCRRKLRSFWIPQRAIGPLSSMYEAYYRYSKGQLPGVITRYRTDTFWKPLRFSNAKAKRRIGWTPHVPMQKALELAVSAPALGSS